MPTIVLPDPGLIVLVGAAGAGKTTFATRHFAPDEVLSSDAFRAVLAGDEADQDATGPAFALLHRHLARRLSAGRLTVVDATNILRSARRPLLHRARTAGVPTVAIVFDLPAAVVIERNAGRAGRVVPTAVVERHLAALRSALDSDRLASDGFDEVVVLRSPDDLDAVVLARRR